MNDIKFIELFAGIGGFRKGLDNVGNFTCVYANEFNKYAASIYERNFNDKPDTRDISTVPAEEIPDHELLVGGFPCQAFSIAGKRGGFEDTRGTLFFEIARIAKQKQPRLLLLENVKGLLSHDKGKTFGTILYTLSELGYDCEWQVLNSKNFGVPQNRERVFIIGHLRGTSRPQVFPIREGNRTTTKELTQGAGQADRVYDINGSSPTVPTSGGGRHEPKIAIPTINPDRENIRQSRRFKEDGDPSYTLVSKFVQGVCIRNPYNGKPPLDMSRIQSKVREDGLSSTITATYYKGLANQHRPGVLDTMRIINPYNGKPSSKETGTLGTSCGTATGKTAQHLYKNNKIRRLTPIECERLQGFPDNWTSEGIDSKGNVVKISDTQRYKTLGNAVTTNVITAIGERLL